jgi:flagellar biogenesis protein FliO
LASATITPRRRRTAKRAVQTSAPVADALDLLADDDDVQDQAAEQPNFALRLTQALEAISAAQPEVEAAPVAHVTPAAEPIEAVTYSRLPRPHALRPAAKPVAPAPAPAPLVEPEPIAELAPVAEPEATQEELDDLLAEPKPLTGVRAFVAALNKLPPIRLPIGPAIPWRYGLPLLFGALLVMVVVARPQGQPEKMGTSLPAQQTYAVQQESPLFAKPVTEAASAPVGVAEPAATASFDLFDVGIKFAAVLGLAYGSLMLLKKVGLGGPAARGSQQMSGVRVVSSLALAPNRTVHVIRTPGGKSLLVGATTSQVNLIADLGELDEDSVAVDSGSFFDILSSKLAK